MARARTGAAGEDDHDDHVIYEEWESVGVRRAPRIGRIMGSGVVIGLALALALTAGAAFSGQPNGPLSTGAGGFLRVFGVLAIVCVGLGLLVSGLIVIVLDRVVGRTARPAIAEHATTLTDDLVSPVSDDPPRWVRDADDLGNDPAAGPSGSPPKG